MKENEKLLPAILTVVLGVLIIIFRAAVIKWAITLLGALLVVLAVFRILKKDYAAGIVEAVIGVAAIVLAWVVVSIIHIILAIVILIYGISDLYAQLKNGIKGKKTLAVIFGLLAPVFTIAAAILLFFDASWIYIAVGILVLLDGIFDLVACLQ